MANSNDALLATVLQELRIKSQNLDKNEFMRGSYGAKDLYLAQTADPNGILSSEVKELAKRSTGRTIKIPVFKADTASVSSGRSCDIDNHEIKSATQGVTFNPFHDGFYMFPNRYVNNEIGYEEHFRKNLNAMLVRWWKKLEALSLANLSTAKNTIWTNANLLNYTQTSNSVVCPFASREEFLADLQSIVSSLGFDGHMNVVGEYGAENIIRHLMEHGVYNSVNRSMEYNDKSFYKSGSLTNASGKFATMYMVPDGQVGILSRVSRAEAAGSTANEHTFGTTYLPGCGDLLFGTHTKTIVGDMAALMQGEGTFSASETSVGDMTCDVAVEYGFSIDLAFVNAYNSSTATRPEGIVKAEVNTAATDAQ